MQSESGYFYHHHEMPIHQEEPSSSSTFQADFVQPVTYSSFHDVSNSSPPIWYESMEPDNTTQASSTPSPNSGLGPDKKEPQLNEFQLRRRREQNRSAQRTFRQRKGQQITDLLRRVHELETELKRRQDEIGKLGAEAANVREENSKLRDERDSIWQELSGSKAVIEHAPVISVLGKMFDSFYQLI